MVCVSLSSLDLIFEGTGRGIGLWHAAAKSNVVGAHAAEWTVKLTRISGLTFSLAPNTTFTFSDIPVNQKKKKEDREGT